MTSLFTPEDLLLYLYGETSPQMTADIRAALQHDWALREELDTLRHLMPESDTKLESPRPQAISNIMSYAREAVGESVDH